MKLLEALVGDRSRELVEAMDPNDRVRLLGAAPDDLAARVLSALSPSQRELTTALLAYPPESAERMMSPESSWLCGRI